MANPQIILIVLDGWGYSTNKDGNAILQAKKPNFDALWQSYPHTLLSASGEEVGLPWGEIGSSEVGHLTIGSGRVIYQDLPRITQSIQNRSFFRNPELVTMIKNAAANRQALHLIGLVSPGGVHSHIDHIFALLSLIKEQRFPGPINLHCITDGRDAPPQSAPLYLEKIEQFIKANRLPARIISVCGRYFAMDRDNHWDRTSRAYELMTGGKGLQAPSALEAVSEAYKRGETDEFIQPTYIVPPKSTSWFKNAKTPGVNPEDNSPLDAVQNNDCLIFSNFRPDRMRQLVELFLFPRQDLPKKVLRQNLNVLTMTEYSKPLPVKVAFPPEHITVPFAKILSDNHLTQLHIAETEKYAHVTYFFNGGNPEPFPGEKWVLIPSPKVHTFDLAPAMSIEKVVSQAISLNKATPFDFMLINFANADMVGHSGKLQPTVEAIEAIDKQLARVVSSFPDTFIIITADHGNAEETVNLHTGQHDTEHSLNPVPFIIVHPSLKLSSPWPTITQPSGILADIAPTMLSILKLSPTGEMTGFNLLQTLSPNPEAFNTPSA